MNVRHAVLASLFLAMTVVSVAAGQCLADFVMTLS
jgi:hypothetical protein